MTERQTLSDFAREARHRLSREIWDFIAGGAGDEHTLRANVAAFDRIRLRPRVLAGVGDPDLSIDVFGQSWPVPVAVAPMAYHTLVHPEGEPATVRAAARFGVPVVLSTFAGRSLEETAAHAGAPLWFQLYPFRDRAQVRDLVERAAVHCAALVVTVDAPRMGRRLRDLRNAFQLPEHVTAANLAPAVRHPEPSADVALPARHARAVMDPTLDWSVLAWLRGLSPLPLVVKGVLTGEDAARAVDEGADGIVVSNHGGRQLDGVCASLEALPEVVAAVAGRCPILLDGGVRRGRDVLAALALGATAVFVGRPVLYALAADGERGVAEMLSLLVEEMTDTMVLSGRRAAADCDASLVDSPR